ncbi:N-6 DNA methylase [Bradyrhizobium sp. Ash2021]|uniref:N-6 DNA methylase n=1 Tax=Bradyrhizobium sp. Ash2021 TaxID=2954771 RepID=UPI002815C490|nr:N-6 DNA methylase [Bradyrhizobium sp. Ash2021]WMT75397.1 BREX-1 system adenine-specific DNA-methyltransferase PglX [Bradyrhizobium sp. Ash2021]
MTQLFTESYMVRFLLHNTLGAWWAGKVLALDPSLAHDAANEDALRAACALPGIAWEYLRFVRDDEGTGPWRPAAGTFPGWPRRAVEITYCDPCCGSGHFLVEAFTILAALRQREESLSASGAAVAVLRDNLHGLELDGRCVQIAAFNVALAAWKLAGAPIPLPSPHIAWVGAPPPMSRTEMAALADGDSTLRGALETLYDQFAQGPLLGSLLQVGARDLLDADLRERGDAASAKLRGAEPERLEGAIAARGLLDAASLIGRRYFLLATNVPFLGRGKQSQGLADFIDKYMPEGKADLATAMLQRMRRMAMPDGAVASVTPQNWFYLGGYERLRRDIILNASFAVVVDLGPAAFQDMNWWAARTALVVIHNVKPDGGDSCLAIDADTGRDLERKPSILRDGNIRKFRQAAQLRNPDARIVLAERSDLALLKTYADSRWGLRTSDSPRFIIQFWETPAKQPGWDFLQSSPTEESEFTGKQQAVFWQSGAGAIYDLSEVGAASIQGMDAWKRRGIAISLMRTLPCGLYDGEIFDNNSAVIWPLDEKNYEAIWSFVSSDQFRTEVRKIHQRVNLTNQTLLKVPFDLAYWKTVADERYPEGLPEPYSDDPTQWLFHGHPAFAARGTELHVALARLAGYRWPAEDDTTMHVSDLAKERIALATALPGTDADGLLPLHPHSSDHPLADRLRHLLTAAFGAALSPVREQALVRAADTKLDKKEAQDATLETWLRDRAFRQHCVLFQHRPFLWQIWDGMKDGFSAFLHYHRLDSAALGTLTYTLLGDWIRTAKAEGQTALQERAEQLQQKLARIIEGENPYDIFVRWKPLARQPVGWDPDLNDGVRLNIRPFMTAGILREQPKGIHWRKDRGSDLASAPWYKLGLDYGGKPSDRINDHHTTLAEKRAARGPP